MTLRQSLSGLRNNNYLNSHSRNHRPYESRQRPANPDRHRNLLELTTPVLIHCTCLNISVTASFSEQSFHLTVQHFPALIVVGRPLPNQDSQQ